MVVAHMSRDIECHPSEAGELSRVIAARKESGRLEEVVVVAARDAEVDLDQVREAVDVDAAVPGLPVETLRAEPGVTLLAHASLEEARLRNIDPGGRGHLVVCELDAAEVGLVFLSVELDQPVLESLGEVVLAVDYFFSAHAHERLRSRALR